MIKTDIRSNVLYSNFGCKNNDGLIFATEQFQILFLKLEKVAIQIAKKS